MCMMFCCNLQIICCQLLRSLNFVMFLAQRLQNHINSGYHVNAYHTTILFRSFLNFEVFCLGLRMYMRFGSDPHINYVTSTLLELLAQLLPKHIDTGILWTQFLQQFCYDIFKSLQVFCLGLKMCMRFVSNPLINYVTFTHFELSNQTAQLLHVLKHIGTGYF